MAVPLPSPDSNKKGHKFVDSEALVITGLYRGLLSALKRYIEIAAPETYSHLKALVKGGERRRLVDWAASASSRRARTNAVQMEPSERG